MNTKWITRVIAIILAAVLFLGLVITPALAAETEAPREEVTVTITEGKESSVGIIGGADGPTAIFVTTSPSGILSTLLLIAGAVCLVVALIKKRKQ